MILEAALNQLDAPKNFTTSMNMGSLENTIDDLKETKTKRQTHSRSRSLA